MGRQCTKCSKQWKYSSAIKRILETLFRAIKMCTDFATHISWVNAICAVSLVKHLKAVAEGFVL